MPTAVIPFTKSFSSTKLNSTAIPARMPIATDIAKIFLAMYLPLSPASLDIRAISAIKTTNFCIILIPFSTVLSSIFERIHMAPAIIIKEAAILATVPPNFV